MSSDQMLLRTDVVAPLMTCQLLYIEIIIYTKRERQCGIKYWRDFNFTVRLLDYHNCKKYCLIFIWNKLAFSLQLMLSMPCPGSAYILSLCVYSRFSMGTFVTRDQCYEQFTVVTYGLGKASCCGRCMHASVYIVFEYASLFAADVNYGRKFV
jgi:hypothetical protein